MISIACIVAITAFLAVRINAQNQSVEVLYRRLVEKGVPIRSVTVESQIPFKIGFTLESSSDNQNLAFDDAWFMQWVRREATLAYRLGLGVSSYTVNVLNVRGEQIAWERNNLYPSDPSQQIITPGVAAVDDTTAERLVRERLWLGEMVLDRLAVTTDDPSGDAGQILMIQASVADLDAANRSLLAFLDSLFQTLDSINVEEGTNLVLCRFRLVDHQGAILLDYVQDIETRQQQWSAVKGLTNEWYPHPPDDGLSDPSPTATPTPISVSPLPTPTIKNIN